MKEIIRYRLCNQQISSTKLRTPGELVEWQGAVQAQDYPSALWGVGLRLPGTRAADIEKALFERKIIRTWPMRGTLHFVPAGDAKWMLELLAPRIIRRIDSYYRKLGLSPEVFRRSEDLIVRALEGGKQLTRGALYEVLSGAGIATNDMRGLFIIGYLAQKAVICFGAREGKQQTFALFDEWVPKGRKLGREEGLAELSRRYFRSHGPATIQDFMWWSGLSAKEANEGVALAGLENENIENKSYWIASPLPKEKVASPVAHLLPNYDEYMISYKDRSAFLPSKMPDNPDNLTLYHSVIIDGLVVGGWRREVKKDKINIKALLVRKLGKDEKEALSAAADRYGAFHGLPVILS